MAFRIFGIDVRADFTFFVVVAFLGAARDARLWLVWIAVASVSVLIHELGHALAGRRLGLTPSIQLYAFGGLTSWAGGGRRLTPAQSIGVSLAGPGAGFMVGFLVLAIAPNLPRDNYLLNAVVGDLIWVNIAWGVLNLVPILPLDGGHVLRSLVHLLRGHPDEVTPLRVSVATGVILAVLALATGRFLAAMLVGFITYQNYGVLRRYGGSR